MEGDVPGALDVWHNCVAGDDGKGTGAIGEDGAQTKEGGAPVSATDDKEALNKETDTSNDETQSVAPDCFVDSEGNEIHAEHVCIVEKERQQPTAPEGTFVPPDAPPPAHTTGASASNDDMAHQSVASGCFVDSAGNELRAIWAELVEKTPEGNVVHQDIPPGETTSTSHDAKHRQPLSSDSIFDADGNELRTVWAQLVENAPQEPIASECIFDADGNEHNPIFVEIVERKVSEHHVVEHDGDRHNATHGTVQVEIVETVQHEVTHYHLSEPANAEVVTETKVAKDAEGVEDVELAKDVNVNDSKDAKDSKDVNDSKDAKECKDVKESKDKGSKVPHPIDTSVASLLTSDGLPALTTADTVSVGYLNAEVKPSCQCPLSHKTLENAHRSSTCGHLYSYTPVMEYVLSFPVVGAPCPVVGCQATINVMSLIPDEEAQATADATAAEHKQAEAATWSAAHVVQ